MLEKLRVALFRSLLRRTLAEQKRQRKAHTFGSARSIGILFDASERSDRRDVLLFTKNLKEEQRKKVKLLGFVDSKHNLGQTLFPQLNQKDLRWNGKPFGEAVDSFVSEKFDLLLCLDKAQIPALSWIAAASEAYMKIGAFAEPPHDFDIVLETPADKGVLFFIDQLDLYLNKIVPSNYEPASAP